MSSVREAIADWAGTVLMAIGIGLLASLMLGGAALILTWSASVHANERGGDALRAAEGVPRKESARGTLLVRSTDGRGLAAVPLLGTDVTIRVSGMVARAHVTQRFVNPSDDWLEGTYVFPLPEDAAVDALRMRIGERRIEGEVRERAAAKAAYVQAKQQGRRSALVEEERRNIFTASVANIAPHAAIEIEIEYQHLARFDAGQFHLRFPMVVGPRYIPSMPIAAGAEGAGWGVNTRAVLDAARITPVVQRPEATAPGEVHNPVNLRIELDSGTPVADVQSPYHPIVVEDAGATRKRIALADGVVPADRDFELVWRPAKDSQPQATVLRDQRDGSHYALVMVVPPADAAGVPGQRLSREVILVIDTSGSMSGASIEQARAALDLALARLGPADTFNVIEFNSDARALFGTARAASRANVEHARRWVARLRAEGGTEMARALVLALDGADLTERLRQVVFITDGAVGNEDELFRLISQRLGASRLFTIGIGSAPNSHFMRTAAELGRGTFTYIGKVDEVAARMRALFARIEAPQARDIRIEWPRGAAVQSYPKRVPDLYAGEPLLVVARLDAPGGEVRISGKLGGRDWATVVSLDGPTAREGQSGIGKLWARSAIDVLLDQERVTRGRSAPDAIAPEQAEIVRIALEHQLVTRHTALIAVDKTPVRPLSSPLQMAAVPANLPAGWNYEAVFGELPQTATPAMQSTIIGLAALLGALLLGLRRRTVLRRPA